MEFAGDNLHQDFVKSNDLISVVSCNSFCGQVIYKTFPARDVSLAHSKDDEKDCALHLTSALPMGFRSRLSSIHIDYHLIALLAP